MGVGSRIMLAVFKGVCAVTITRVRLSIFRNGLLYSCVRSGWVDGGGDNSSAPSGTRKLLPDSPLLLGCAHGNECRATQRLSLAGHTHFKDFCNQIGYRGGMDKLLRRKEQRVAEKELINQWQPRRNQTKTTSPFAYRSEEH